MLSRGIKITLLSALIVLIIASMAGQVKAGIWGGSITPDDLSDSRTLSELTSNNWGGFQIGWNIDFNSTTTGLWHYEYTLTADTKAISYMLMELTPGMDGNDLNSSQTFTYDSAWGYQNDNATPGWPGGAGGGVTMNGIKFDFGSITVTYTFDTAIAPVWGNFYAKDGAIGGAGSEKLYAYNNAFGIANFESSDPNDFIVRPDGSPIVPEPVSSTLFIVGAATMGFRRYRKNRKL